MNTALEWLRLHRSNKKPLVFCFDGKLYRWYTVDSMISWVVYQVHIFLRMWYEGCLAPTPLGHLVTADNHNRYQMTHGLFDWVIYEHFRIPVRNVCCSKFKYIGLKSHMPSPFDYVGLVAVTKNMLRFNNCTVFNMLHTPLLWFWCIFRTNIGLAINPLAYWCIYVQKEWVIIC